MFYKKMQQAEFSRADINNAFTGADPTGFRVEPQAGDLDNFQRFFL